MEFQDQPQSEWGQSFFYDQPPAEFDHGSVEMVGISADPYCNVWTDGERTAVWNCNSGSFATNARLRLESLKSGYNSASPRCIARGPLDKYKHPCGDEDSQEEESVLDSVELLDLEGDLQEEESWLYQSPKKMLDNRSQSALGWCRHVLDNPGPEAEAARRSLLNKLQHCSDRYFYTRAAVFHTSGSVDSSTPRASDSTDCPVLNHCGDSTNSSYRLQDITDVHIIARMQEASLRHDYISAPVPRRGAEPPPPPPRQKYFDTSDETVELTSGAAPSSRWRSGLPLPGAFHQFVPSAESKHGCQSPKLSRLQQQVTQFKLLKLAQNQGAATVRTRSPLRTSLRSLQAVRNSRSLDADDDQPADSPAPYPPSGASPDKSGTRFWPPLPAVPPVALLRSLGDPGKRLQRSQSSSPHRAPHSAKGHLSLGGRVFASPERSAALAWARGGPPSHR